MAPMVLDMSKSYHCDFFVPTATIVVRERVKADNGTIVGARCLRQTLQHDQSNSWGQTP